jgi:ABC-type multidrug transport system ATPase subunit
VLLLSTPQQEHALVAMLAVEETLRFAAQLNTPAGTSRERVAALVAEAQAAVGLLGKESSLVGGELQGGLRLRGLSGGEQRRLSIACQVGCWHRNS